MPSASPPPNDTRERLLALLKRGEADTHADLATTLGLGTEAVRQQLCRLERDGLVASVSEPRGVGRPVRVWRLTAEGHATFPDGHARLATGLLDAVRDVLGDDALAQVLHQRAEAVIGSYQRALAGLDDLGERVARLAALRTAEGYEATWSAGDDGGFELVEHHCATCSAARACRSLCDEELRAFRAVLGEGVEVTRTEHLMAGGARCAYGIRRTA